MKVKYIIKNKLLVLAMATISLGIGYAITSKIAKADIQYIPSYCSSQSTIDLIVIDINNPNNTSGNSIVAYGKNGNLVTQGRAFLGRDTYRSIGQKSVFANANKSCQATPLGVFSTGKIWRTNKNDLAAEQMGYDWTESVSSPDKLGRLFVELSGVPVDGGSAVGGISTDLRHVGIHSSAASRANLTTLGCAKTSGSVVDTITNNLPKNTPTKVIVSDQEVAGVVNVPSPIVKVPTSTVSIIGPDGMPVKVHTYHGSQNWWIAEVARPEGKYKITVSASGFKTATTEVTYVRDSNHKLTQKKGATDVTLSLN